MVISAKQLAHVCVFTDNVAASDDFYTRVLGLKKIFDFTRKGEVIGFYLQLGARTFIEVFIHSEAPFIKTGPVNHLCIEVEDIEAAVKALRGLGIEVTDTKYGVDHTWQAWLKDPSGTPIELFQYTEKSTQFTGGDVEADW